MASDEVLPEADSLDWRPARENRYPSNSAKKHDVNLKHVRETDTSPGSPTHPTM